MSLFPMPSAMGRRLPWTHFNLLATALGMGKRDIKYTGRFKDAFISLSLPPFEIYTKKLLIFRIFQYYLLFSLLIFNILPKLYFEKMHPWKRYSTQPLHWEHKLVWSLVPFCYFIRGGNLLLIPSPRSVLCLGNNDLKQKILFNPLAAFSQIWF